jgi:hypothetical protein
LLNLFLYILELLTILQGNDRRRWNSFVIELHLFAGISTWC